MDRRRSPDLKNAIPVRPGLRLMPRGPNAAAGCTKQGDCLGHASGYRESRGVVFEFSRIRIAGAAAATGGIADAMMAAT
jgi:hypothetical protein